MSHVHVVESLSSRGLDNDVLSTISGQSFTSIQNAANGNQELESFVLDKLYRLDNVLNDLPNEKIDFFAKHVISLDKDGERIWLFLHQVWGNALIDDHELKTYLLQTPEVFTLKETVDTWDNNREAVPSEYLDFRELVVKELNAVAA